MMRINALTQQRVKGSSSHHALDASRVSGVRRRQGSGLTRNEQKLLAAALRLAVEGQPQIFGYELYRAISEWEGAEPMNHGTIYRCMRALETRGFVERDEEATEDDDYRVFYVLTRDGVGAARQATIQLAALDDPPRWVDIRTAAAVPPTD